jgi:hypothetical protein
MDLEQRIKHLEEVIGKINLSDRFYLSKPLQLQDGRKIITGKTNGTIIGSEITQKLGFWNTTPVVQDQFHFNGTISNTWGAVEQATLSNIQRILISYGLIIS